MIINRNTSIKALLDEKPEEVLRALEGLNRNFRRLRNPVLRKLLAKRVSIEQACGIAGCNVREFFEAMEIIGFDLKDEGNQPVENPGSSLDCIAGLEIVEMDVRPVLKENLDPLKQILDKVKELNDGQCLKIVNSFEPVPLVSLLAKKGFDAVSDHLSAELVHTYFYKTRPEIANEETITPSDDPFDKALTRFTNQMLIIDVRDLEMPGPMHAILENLEKMPEGYALFVHHKKVPVYLLPHLHDKGYQYLICEEKGKISMLIFKE